MIRSSSLLLGLIAIGGSMASAQVAKVTPPPPTAFVGVAVVPMDTERVLANQTVIVQDGRITALGPAKRVTVPVGAVRVDGRGKYLMPGLADMHVHIGFMGDTSVPFSDVLFAYLANGVTTVRDMHSGRRAPEADRLYAQAWRFELRQQLASGAMLGPRLYTAGDPDYSSPEAAARSVTELKADGHDFVKMYLEERWPKQQALYDSIMGAAHRVGLRVVGHVPPGLPIPQMLADNWASTEHFYEYHEYLLGLGGRWSLSDFNPEYVDTMSWMRPDYRLDQAKLRELAEATRRAGVWNCPTLALRRDLATSMMEAARTGSASGLNLPYLRTLDRFADFDLQLTKALQDAGAGLLVGTDVGGNWIAPIGFIVHRELARLVTAGLTPYQALAAGTKNAATFLGTLDSTGTIAVGKRADLLLLSGNPLKDVGFTAGPAGVMVGGRWVSRAEIDARFDVMKTAKTDDFYGLLQQARREIWKH